VNNSRNSILVMINPLASADHNLRSFSGMFINKYIINAEKGTIVFVLKIEVKVKHFNIPFTTTFAVKVFSNIILIIIMMWR